MYSIYAKVGKTKVCLHDSTVSNPKVKVVEPVLTLEDSAAGSLTFKMAPNNQAYGSITEYDEMMTGFDEVTVNEIVDDQVNNLKNGTINGDGTEAASTTNLVSKTAYAISSNVSAISTDIVIQPGYHDILSDLVAGSVDDSTDTSMLHTDSFFEVLSTQGRYRVYSTMAAYQKDLLDLFTVQGLPFDKDTATMSRKFVSTEAIPSSCALYTNAKDYINLLVNPVNDGVQFYWRYYGYDADGTLTGSMTGYYANGETTQVFAFARPGEGVIIPTSWYRLAISRVDYSDVIYQGTRSISGVASIYDKAARMLQWRLVFFDDSFERIVDGESDWQTISNAEVQITTTGVYYKVEFRFNTLEDISTSDITALSIENMPTSKFMLAWYNSSDSFLGLTSWLNNGDSANVSTVPGAAKFKIVVAANAYGPYDYNITPADTALCTTHQNTIVTEMVPREVDIVARMQSTITVYRKEWNANTQKYEENEIWEGRVLIEDKDFYNLRSIQCEGELAYLNDTCQPQREYHGVGLRQFLEAVLNYHNSRVADEKKFYVGQIWVQDDESDGYRYTQYQKTMEVVNDLVSKYGGHIKIRKTGGKRYIDWFDDYGEDNNPTQTINFGKNLLDYTCNWDMSELCTVLLPTGHVVQEAQKSSAGDPLPLNGGAGPTPCQLLTKGSDGRVYVQANPNLGGYKTAVAVVEPEKNYYFSGRLHGGLVAYTIKSNADGSGDYYDGGTKTAGSEGQVGFVDFVDQKITIPAGAHSVVMCSFGDDIPLALKAEIPATEGLDTYLTVEDCADDEGWHQKGSLYVVNQEAVNTYGWIEKQMALEDIEDKDLLYKSAKLYLQDGQFDQMTLEITAIDMNLLGAKTDYINLLDLVHVISRPHGVDKYLPVTKLEIPLDNPADQKFTLGTNTEQSLTSVNNDLNADMLNRINGLPTMSETIRSAKANSAELINSALTGYVTIVQDTNPETGQQMPRELVISNQPIAMVDGVPTTGDNAYVWRWNVNGLGFSDHGYQFTDDNLRAAITADGRIVADSILAGTLRGIKIQGCEIVAGGMDGQIGKIYVLASTIGGTYAIELDNGQISFGTYNASNNPPFTKFADIKGNVEYDVGGQIKHGIRIATPVLALDTDYMWVSESSSGGNPGVGYNGRFQVKDNNNRNVELVFTRGILLSKTDLQ